MNLKGRHLLKIMDLTPEEMTYLIDLAADLKAKKKGRRASGYVSRQKYSADF